MASVTSSSGEAFLCDDGTDCTSEGMTCCRSDATSATCGYRAAVDAEPCGLEVCNTEEGAAPCPRGQSCLDGVCRPASQRATCGPTTRCPADAPICAWESGRGRCITTREADSLLDKLRAGEDAPSVFACTKKSDCGAGHACCAGTSFSTEAGGEHATTCRYGCGGPRFEEVCETSSDCSPFFATGANGGATKATCAKRPPSPRYPAWAGQCSP